MSAGAQAADAAGAPPSQQENPPLSNQPPVPVGEQTSTGTSRRSRRTISSNKPQSVPTDPDDFRNISVGAKKDENLPTSSSPFVTNDEFQ